MLSRDKALAKKLLAYHRIPVPDFAVVPRRPRRSSGRSACSFPLIVKSLTYESSIGISQASVVENEDKLRERVQFIHDNIGTAAIVEQFIDGRELYVGVLGNEAAGVPGVGDAFAKMPEDSWHIATERVKWSGNIRRSTASTAAAANDLPEDVQPNLQQLCKRVYRALDLSGYARIDLRLDADGRMYVIEANPNPQLAYGEDFAESAEHAGGVLRGAAPAHHHDRPVVAAGATRLGRDVPFAWPLPPPTRPTSSRRWTCSSAPRPASPVRSAS